MRKDINPKQWGSAGWKFIDAIIDGYPDIPTYTEITAMTNFLHSLGYLLPCAQCRYNFFTYSTMHPPEYHANNKDNIRDWIQRYKNEHRNN